MNEVHTDNKETLYNALNRIAELENKIADIKQKCLQIKSPAKIVITGVIGRNKNADLFKR